MVITCNPIFPNISITFLSSDDVQNHIFEDAMRNDEVRGSFEYVQIYMPLVRVRKTTVNSKRSLDKLCVNWKRGKKSKRINLKDFAVIHSEKHVKSMFGWKPKWNSHGSAYDASQKHVGGRWKKFDGVHP